MPTPAPEPSQPPQQGHVEEPFWVVTGPTASGKSALALQLAERLDMEILSMDSMAVYRAMDIGTAKPSAEDRNRIPHHLIDLVDPSEPFDTARWCEHAQAAVEAVRSRGRQPLFVGGTPLYLMAFFKGLLQGPARDESMRMRLEAQEDALPGSLHERLLQVDPEAAARIHRRDRKRLVRALEVYAVTGKPISEQQQHFEREGWQRPCRIVALNWPREQLHGRVRQRTEAMLDSGLVDEIAAIQRQKGFSDSAAAAIGYRECIDFLRGRYKDREELRNRIRRNTHRLIRRQLTWLRRIPELRWLSPTADAIELEATFRSAPATPPTAS